MFVRGEARIIGEVGGNGGLQDAICGDTTDHGGDSLEFEAEEMSNTLGLAGTGGSFSRAGDIDDVDEYD